MKSYGLPRSTDIEFPDVASIQEFGLKSSTGRFQTRSGNFKPYIRDVEARHATRRYWKKKERMSAFIEIRSAIVEYSVA